MKWGLWSTTAGSNSATPPDGWPEGQAPSTVNDCAREMMAQIRTAINDLQFVDLGDSPTFVSATKFSIPGNLTATYQIGRRLKILDGGSGTLYGFISDASGSAVSTTVTVLFDGGVMTGSISAVAVATTSHQNNSLPLTAYRNENVLINPYLDIWKGPTSFVNPANGTTLLADMFKLAMSMSATLAVNITRSNRAVSASSVPTLAQSGVMFENSICVSISTGVATIAAGAFMYLDTRVEGINFRQLAQKPMAFQFWVKSNRTGTYCIALQNSGIDQSYLSEFSVSSTAWECKKFTIPPSPSAGTWNYSNGIGLAARITLVSGSTFQGGAGNWTAVNVIATSNQQNFCSSANNAIRLTGFQLQEGTQCGPLMYKNLTDEELRCQRYRPAFGFGSNASNPLGIGQVVNVAQALISVNLMVPARTMPTGFNFNGNATTGFVVASPTNALAQCSAISVNITGLTNVQLLATTVGASGLGAAGDATYFSNTVAGTSFYLSGADL